MGASVGDDGAAAREYQRERRKPLRRGTPGEARARVRHSESSGTPTMLSRRERPEVGEVADLLRAGSERVPVGALAVRRRQRLGDGRQQRAQCRPDVLGERGALAYRLPQEPGAVGDVALLVVVDLRVALDEAGQQLLSLEVAGDEIEGGQPERALDDHVVGGDEVDLGAGVRRLGHESLVRLNQRLVEDRRERGRELLARPCDVLADRLRIRDHLVLEARVELHVPRLVHLLRGQERGLLLGAVGAHQPRELRGDALLGHHERGERPEDQERSSPAISPH